MSDPTAPDTSAARPPTRRARTSLLSRGEPMLWLTGGATIFGLLMILGLLALVFMHGMQTFWPSELLQVDTHDSGTTSGRTFLGEPTREETYALPDSDLAALPPESMAQVAAQVDFTEAAAAWQSDTPPDVDLSALEPDVRAEIAYILGHPEIEATVSRVLLRTGNFEFSNTHYTWVPHHEMAQRSEPEWALTIERRHHGNFYGLLEHATLDGEVATADPAAAWAFIERYHPEIRERQERIKELEDQAIGHESHRIKRAQLATREAEIALETRGEDPATSADEWRLGWIVAIVLAIGTVLAVVGRARTAPGPGRSLQLWLGITGAIVAITVLTTTWTLSDPSESEAELTAQLEQLRAQEARITQEAEEAITDYRAQAAELKAENARYGIGMTMVDGRKTVLPLAEVVRTYPANHIGWGDRLGIYFSRWREFIFDDPRHANSEGGVWPAIFGTVVMTLLMTVLAVPFGVLAALYLREYASSGPVVSAIRIAINNLAGVPSIVFGVFGLGFFCYLMGGWIDTGPGVGIPLVAWLAALAAVGLSVALAVSGLIVNKQFSQSGRVPGGLLAVIALSVFALLDLVTSTLVSPWITILFLLAAVGLALPMWFAGGNAGTNAERRLPRTINVLVGLMWIKAIVLAIFFIGGNPYFDGFYRAQAPTPHFGTGGVLWASMTLALLTLPVVIVATEEAMAAVPGSMREGSYACGASKWQTIKRIVLPRSMPGILTGMILAIARGAGEVAPLMLVGAVKLAPELPLDFSDWSGNLGALPIGPLHPERSFMHLGFHIYDLGFQSPNAEAAKPMVFTTTLLLIAIVVMLNLTAIWLRTRIARKFVGGHF